MPFNAFNRSTPNNTIPKIARFCPRSILDRSRPGASISPPRLDRLDNPSIRPACRPSITRRLDRPLALGWAIFGYMFTSESSRPRTLEHDPKPTTANLGPRTVNRAPRSTPGRTSIHPTTAPDRRNVYKITSNVYQNLVYTPPDRHGQWARIILPTLECQPCNTEAYSSEGFGGVSAAIQFRRAPSIRALELSARGLWITRLSFSQAAGKVIHKVIRARSNCCNVIFSRGLWHCVQFLTTTYRALLRIVHKLVD